MRKYTGTGFSLIGHLSVSRIVATCVFVVLTCQGVTAWADAPKRPWGPVQGVTLGPSVGYATYEDTRGVAVGVDASYFHRIKLPLYFWVSAGGRAIFEADTVPVMPYVETGLGFILLNIGGGYSLALNQGDNVSHVIQLFLGINAPIWSPKKGQLFYFEIYYRPGWDVSGPVTGTRHEVGGQLRWMWGSRKEEMRF